MKKTLITTLAAVSMASGAFAQGSLSGLGGLFNNTYLVAGPGSGTSVSDTVGAFTGNLSLEMFYAPTANVTSGQISAINALDGTSGGGAAALALLGTDGFTLASAISAKSTTAGSIAETASLGGLTGADGVSLTAGTPTGTVGWIAMYLVANGGTYNTYSGVLAWSQNTGGNPLLAQPGIPAGIAGDPAGQINLVLTAPAAVPEPTTMVLAGLGGLSLMALRRKK